MLSFSARRVFVFEGDEEAVLTLMVRPFSSRVDREFAKREYIHNLNFRKHTCEHVNPPRSDLGAIAGAIDFDVNAL